MTEEEARKRWCPFTRVYNASTAVNRWGTPEDRKAGKRPFGWITQCVASDCMAWDGSDCRKLQAPTINFYPGEPS